MTFKVLNLRKIHKVELLKRLFDNKIETPTAKEKREIHKIIESSIINEPWEGKSWALKSLLIIREVFTA